MKSIHIMTRTGIIAFMVLLVLTTFAFAQEDAQKQEAEVILQKAEAAIARMDQAGFDVSESNTMLHEAEDAYEQGYYGQTIQLASRVNKRMETALAVYLKMSNTQKSIDANSASGHNVRQASDLLELASIEFGKEQYEQAQQYIDQAQAANDEVTLANAPPQASLMNTQRGIAVGIIVVLAGFFILVAPKIRKLAKADRIKRLKSESNSLNELIVSAEQKYYKGRGVSKEEYESTISEYERRKAEILLELKKIDDA